MTNINPFYSAKCTPEALDKMQEIREVYKTLNDALIALENTAYKSDSNLLLGMRELNLAKTNLEQSSMWAIKCISHFNIEE